MGQGCGPLHLPTNPPRPQGHFVFSVLHTHDFGPHAHPVRQAVIIIFIVQMGKLRFEHIMFPVKASWHICGSAGIRALGILTLGPSFVGSIPPLPISEDQLCGLVFRGLLVLTTLGDL